MNATKQAAAHTPLIRYDSRTGQYVPQLNGKDLPITTFSEERAIDIARAALEASKP